MRCLRGSRLRYPRCASSAPKAVDSEAVTGNSTLTAVKILIVDTCYPAFLAHHYASRPALAKESYAAQWQALMSTFFGTADSYSHYLGQIGHEAHEVVVNAELLQRAWAAEHGLGGRLLPRVRRHRALRDVLLAQVEDFRPDVVYVQDLGYLPVEMLQRIRAMTGLLVGQLGSEPPIEQLAVFDLLCTSFPHFVPRLREAGRDVEYFRIGFDPRVLDHLHVDRTAGAVFVGTLAHSRWQNANALVERAARRAQIEIWGFGGEDDWPSDSPFGGGRRGEAWGLDMYRVLASARIAVNRHGDIAGDYANNMRLFEATGVGTLLLTEEKRNLHELFRVGEEVVEYRDEDDLVRKIEYYVEHEDERAPIAAAGQQRTLRDHTYRNRMAELVDILACRLD